MLADGLKKANCLPLKISAYNITINFNFIYRTKNMKALVVFNIGSRGGILNSSPIVWYGDLSDFSKSIRTKRNIKMLFKWAKDNHVPPSLMRVHLTVIDSEFETEFTFNLIGVREYKKHWEQVYKTPFVKPSAIPNIA